MIPEPGSVAWKRETLRAEAERLEESALHHHNQALLACTFLVASIDEDCAARAAYCAQVLRTVAQNLWPPERGLTPGELGLVAAYLDGQEPLQPLTPPLTRPEAREDV